MPRLRRTQPDAGLAVLPLLGAVLAAAGFVLLAVQVLRTLTGGVLGTIGLALMWVGVGALTAGLVLLVLVVAGVDGGDDARAASAEPGAGEPAVPTSSPAAPTVAPAPPVTPVTEPAAPPVETATAADYAQPADSATSTTTAGDPAEDTGHA